MSSLRDFLSARLRSWGAQSSSLWPNFLKESTPLDLRIVGRVVLHAALVGVAAGFVGAAFFGSLEFVQRLLLESLAGYDPLRAYGESMHEAPAEGPFRPWLLVFLPALGGLACGLITRIAPEARGGGGDAMIEAFHQRSGILRRRLIWVKPLASLFTLGTGGAGGREGPTMQIGGAIGSVVARVLSVSVRERRILLVAGVAAGISAVFRTPLGAALLAVEVLYRDGFESDALIPSVLASVVAYSIVISIFGESTLFSHAPRFPFIPEHLPLYAIMALMVALLAAVFVGLLGRSRKFFQKLPVPDWARPAVGGLALGLFAVPLVVLVSAALGREGQGLGLLGGGYGAVQMAISGVPWLPGGWSAVQLLCLLALAKLIAASLTIGSGGSAGDFAPSLAIGGLLGGAFGRAMQLLFENPSIDPGAFALVGMGVFYGGIAHVPLAALVLVCELAGNYDLLVPLMLAQGIAFVALRNRALYGAQAASPLQTPAHRDDVLSGVWHNVSVHDAVGESVGRAPVLCLRPEQEGAEVVAVVQQAPWQPVFPVKDASGGLLGVVIIADLVRAASVSASVRSVMRATRALSEQDNLHCAAKILSQSGLAALPVIDAEGQVVGLFGESDLARLYLRSANEAPAPSE